MKNSNSFSPDDFKQWMQNQVGFSASIPKVGYIGLTVNPMIPKKRIAPHMCVIEGMLDELVGDFAKHGGKVVEVDGKHLVVEVSSGSFSIPQNCVRQR
jgi:hypothetical protein